MMNEMRFHKELMLSKQAALHRRRRCTSFIVCTAALSGGEVRSCQNSINYDILAYMTKLLEEAMAKVSQLPEATQQSIAEDLIAHVTNVEHLRAELKKGIDSLDRGE